MAKNTGSLACVSAQSPAFLARPELRCVAEALEICVARRCKDGQVVLGKLERPDI